MAVYVETIGNMLHLHLQMLMVVVDFNVLECCHLTIVCHVSFIHLHLLCYSVTTNVEVLLCDVFVH